MKKYFAKYRSFLLFLGKFFFTYAILIILYQVYLGQFDTAKFEPDGLTTVVAKHTKAALELLNYTVTIQPHESEPSYRLFVGNKSVVRIIEGCNAVSVMILFIAFIVAFSGKFKRTVLFIICGILLIHVLNVARIAALILGLLYYPEYENMLHDIVFPLFIYGVVFGLWVLWVNKYSHYAGKTA